MTARFNNQDQFIEILLIGIDIKKIKLLLLNSEGVQIPMPDKIKLILH